MVMIVCTLLYSYVRVKNYLLSAIVSDLVSLSPGVPPLNGSAYPNMQDPECQSMMVCDG